MGKTVWKQVLAVKEVQTLEVPKGAKFVSCGAQDGNISVWYECDPEEPDKERVVVCVYATGDSHYSDGGFLGTVMFDGGVHVYHVYTARKEGD